LPENDTERKNGEQKRELLKRSRPARKGGASTPRKGRNRQLSIGWWAKEDTKKGMRKREMTDYCGGGRGGV